MHVVLAVGFLLFGRALLDPTPVAARTPVEIWREREGSINAFREEYLSLKGRDPQAAFRLMDGPRGPDFLNSLILLNVLFREKGLPEVTMEKFITGDYPGGPYDSTRREETPVAPEAVESETVPNAEPASVAFTPGKGPTDSGRVPAAEGAAAPVIPPVAGAGGPQRPDQGPRRRNDFGQVGSVVSSHARDGGRAFNDGEERVAAGSFSPSGNSGESGQMKVEGQQFSGDVSQHARSGAILGALEADNAAKLSAIEMTRQQIVSGSFENINKTGLAGVLAKEGFSVQRGQVVNKDGSAATPAQIADLRRELASAPGAALRDPGYAPILADGTFQAMKQTVAVGGEPEQTKHMGLSSDKRDVAWKKDCDKVSGECNKNADKSYKEGEAVSASALKAAWKRIAAAAAERESAGVHAKLNRSIFGGGGGSLFDRFKGLFSGGGGKAVSGSSDLRLASAGALPSSSMDASGSAGGKVVDPFRRFSGGATAEGYQALNSKRQSGELQEKAAPLSNSRVWIWIFAAAAALVLIGLGLRRKDWREDLFSSP